jgi:hypothetical protein
MRTFRKVAATAAGLLGALILFPGPAAATTFDGTCALSGAFSFDPTLGVELQATDLKDRAAGACTGTLDGVYRVDTPVQLKASGSGTLSCFAGEASTEGVVIFTKGTSRESDDSKIGFSTQGTAAALESIVYFRGTVSGQGVAYVTFLPYADESGMQACQAGELQAARYDVDLRTLTPVVG